MKQSKKTICALAALCVVLAIAVCVLLIKVLTPQAPDAEVRDPVTQTPDAEVRDPAAQTPDAEVLDPVTQTPDAEVRDPVTQPSGDMPSGQNPDAEQGLQDIGQETAKNTALAHAGLTESQVTGMKVERDWEDGRPEYEVEFWYGTTEYDYTIDGYSCAILKQEQEQHGDIQIPAAQAPDAESRDPVTQPSGDMPSGQNPDAEQGLQDIGQETAKNTALAHAGLTESQVTGMKVERDWEDGRPEYEVEFKSGGMEYEYTIDGITGAVLSCEKEIDD